MLHLFSREGKRDELVEWFEAKLAGKGIILTPKDYPLLMGEGANKEHVIQRLGDVQVLLGKNASMFFGHSGDFDPTYGLGLNATHGSLSKNELEVPLIVSRADELAKSDL